MYKMPAERCLYIDIKMTYINYVLDIFNYIEKSDWDNLAQSLSSSDRTCTDEIRCHCFTMDTGHCLRINTVPMYMESNKLVSARKLCSAEIVKAIYKLSVRF